MTRRGLSQNSINNIQMFNICSPTQIINRGAFLRFGMADNLTPEQELNQAADELDKLANDLEKL